MREWPLALEPERVIAACRARGLVVRSRGALPERPGGVRWRLGLPGRSGTLDLNRWHDRVWFSLASERAGSWAVAVAEELSRERM
ncbi:MAG: hypothetical protein M3024_09445 [Candidatus Dormibacteraeota bacterium]|nr:hypothetical protein [Candidatus Dormibacteraeota bacterium]